MAQQCKRSHIRIDQGIWDDGVMVNLSPEAFKVWVFGIAWSKSQAQEGRVPDGILTQHGLSRIGATPEILAELSSAKSKLLTKLPDGSYEIVKYSQWQVTYAEQQQAHEARVAGGMISAHRKAFGNEEDLPPIENGFGWRAAFDAAFDHWPNDNYREGKAGALVGFRTYITNQATYDMFEAALVARVRSYKADKRPPSQKRQYLGAFKNFCDPDRWMEWVPNSMKPKQEPQSHAPATEEGTAAQAPPAEEIKPFLGTALD